MDFGCLDGGWNILIPHVIPFWNPWDHGSTLELFSRFFVWMFGLIMYNETTHCSRFIFTLVTAVLHCLIFGMFMCSETTLCNSLIFTLVTSVCHYSMLCVMRLSTVVALYSHWSQLYYIASCLVCLCVVRLPYVIA